MKACDYCIFIFYFLLNLFTIISLCTFGKDLFTRFSPFFLITFFSTAILSYYLLLIIRKDPGIVKSIDYTNLESTIIENTNLSQNNNLRDLELISVPTNNSLNNENRLINEEESKIEELMLSKCEKCVIEIPLRAKHCSRCGHCIRKFDHHCFIVGGCIGEKNHFKFYIYLFSQTLALILAIFAILDTVSYYLESNHEKYLKVPIILYILIIVLAMYCLLTTILFMFHSYLIFTNQTTYEIYHKDKMPYLKKFKDTKKLKLESLNIRVPASMPFHPFDLGVIDNLKMIYYNNEN